MAIALLASITYFFGIRPITQINEWSGSLEAKDYLALRNNALSGLAQALGGAILLMGLFFTWRNIRATEKNVEIAQENIAINQDNAARNLAITQKNLDITQENIRTTQATAAKSLALSIEAQMTERFTNAIEQIGNRDSLALRLGGIYALERIAQDSQRDHWPIVEILSAYIRESAPWQPSEGPAPATPKEALDAIQEPKPDIQAILNVLGRRTLSHELKDQHMNCVRADLRRSDLRGAHFEKANLSQSHLEWSFLENAHFEESTLNDAHLGQTFSKEADFRGAWLLDANLDGARLRGAHFESAYLIGASFVNAHLSNAHFEQADLSFVNFRGARLYRAFFHGASLDGTNLEGVNLKTVTGLTKEQVDSAVTNQFTQLPEYVISDDTTANVQDQQSTDK